MTTHDTDPGDEQRTYRVERHYHDDAKERDVIWTGLTRQEAQDWCKRDDTHGEGWFDGWTEE